MKSAPTVLVVEDEPLVRMDIAGELATRGFAVLEACNSAEAVKLLHTHEDVDAVLTDVDMPGSMDGFQLASFVRANWPIVRIIIVSGHANPQLSTLPEGTFFFGKPYEPDAVITAIREAISA